MTITTLTPSTPPPMTETANLALGRLAAIVHVQHLPLSIEEARQLLELVFLYKAAFEGIMPDEETTDRCLVVVDRKLTERGVAVVPLC